MSLIETWGQFFELLETQILRQEPIVIEDLLPLVRHLPLPRDGEEPLKAYLRSVTHDYAAKHGINIYFLYGRCHYAVTRAELVKLFRRQEKKLRSEGKRYATIAYKIHQVSQRKRESPQLQFNFEASSIDVPAEMLRSTDPVGVASNVVPLRPWDEDVLWSQMTVAFTTGNPEQIPPFSKVLAEFVRRQLGVSVPEEVFREEYVPVAQLRSIYDDLASMVIQLVESLPEGQPPKTEEHE